MIIPRILELEHRNSQKLADGTVKMSITYSIKELKNFSI